MGTAPSASGVSRIRAALMLAVSLGSVTVISGACDGDNPFILEDVTAVEITTPPPVLEAGSSVQLAFEVRDADGNLIDPNDVRIDFFSNNAAVAMVSETGLVTSVTVGTATITIETGSVSDAVTVTVVPEISSLEIVEAELNLITGETFAFGVIVLNMAGDPVPDPRSFLTFSSSRPAVASVDDNGFVTGAFPGSATITAEGGGERDSIQVTVFAAMSQGILLRFTAGNSFTVQAGDELVIDNTAPPGGVPFVLTDSGTELDFSSTNASVATVDAAGLLVAHAPGVAFITITSPDHPGDSATMRLKVIEAGSIDVFQMAPVTGSIQLAFDPAEQVPLQLQLNVEVDGERIIDFLPRLSSSDESVAVAFPFRGFAQPMTLDPLVVGVAPGTATITAQTGVLTAESVITVLPSE